MIRTHRALPESLRVEVFAALYRFGVSDAFATRAYRMWREGVAADECVYGVKGQQFATQCQCDGCSQGLCFELFSNVARNLARGTITI